MQFEEREAKFSRPPKKFKSKKLFVGKPIHRVLDRLAPAFVKIISLVAFHFGFEARFELPSRFEFFLIFPDTDSQAREVSRTEDGRRARRANQLGIA